MKAFLSHSSKDKTIVDQVAKYLGAGSTIYDRESFEEGKRSADEILRGLSASDLFVLFLSGSALQSSWVQQEIAGALQNIFAGTMKGVLVFAVDGSSHTSLPGWLQAYNVERTDKPAQISRRIRSRLIELQLEQSIEPEIFVGRENELRRAQKALTLPSDELAPVIAVMGWQGLGRRTFITKAFQDIYPYLKHVQPTILLGENDWVQIQHGRELIAALERFAA